MHGVLAESGEPAAIASIAHSIRAERITFWAVGSRDETGSDVACRPSVGCGGTHAGGSGRGRRSRTAWSVLGGLWSGPKVATFVHRAWGVEVCPQTGWKWLVDLGFTLRVEWAYRHVIEQPAKTTPLAKKNITLERILCVPAWRQQFDDLVWKLMEKAQHQFPVLDYHRAAMTIRKRSGESRRTEPSLFDDPIPVARADVKLPERPGVYLIRSDNDRIFTGWTDNLRYQVSYLREAGAGCGAVLGARRHRPGKDDRLPRTGRGNPRGPTPRLVAGQPAKEATLVELVRRSRGMRWPRPARRNSTLAASK